MYTIIPYSSFMYFMFCVSVIDGTVHCLQQRKQTIYIILGNFNYLHIKSNTYSKSYSMFHSTTVSNFVKISLWPPCAADADIIFIVDLWNRADHYIFILWFLLSSFLPHRRRLDVYHTSTHGVALVRI